MSWGIGCARHGLFGVYSEVMIEDYHLHYYYYFADYDDDDDDDDNND